MDTVVVGYAIPPKKSSSFKVENNALFMDYKPPASLTKNPPVSQTTCHNAQMVKTKQ